MDNSFEQDFLANVKTTTTSEQNQLLNTSHQEQDGALNKSKGAPFIYGILGTIIVVLIVMMVLMGLKLVQNSNELNAYREMYESIEDGIPEEYTEGSGMDVEEIKMILSCVDKGEKQYAFYNDNTYYVIDLMEAMELESGTYETDWMTSIIVKSEDNNDRTIQLTGDEIVDGDLTYKCKKK